MVVHVAFILTILAFGRTEAITKLDKTAFAGVDTLKVEINYETDDGFVSKKQLRTKMELVLRTAGVPVYTGGTTGATTSMLSINLVALELLRGKRGTGDWAFALEIALSEIVTVRRNGHSERIKAWTWNSPLTLAVGQKKELQDRLFEKVEEVAEEVSNLYLATR